MTSYDKRKLATVMDVKWLEGISQRCREISEWIESNDANGIIGNFIGERIARASVDEAMEIVRNFIDVIEREMVNQLDNDREGLKVTRSYTELVEGIIESYVAAYETPEARK